MAHESKLAVGAALAGNAAIAVTKFIGAAMTGSSAMLSESIHSTVDTADQILLIVGMKRAALPADEEHPFGHGKELYFWSLIVAVLIFGAGGGVSAYEGAPLALATKPLTAARRVESMATAARRSRVFFPTPQRRLRARRAS